MSTRPFPHLWLWRSLYFLALISVVVLSLVSNDALHKVDFIGNDKIGHFLAYFVLMAFAVQLFDTLRDWLIAATGLLSLSIALEVLQNMSGLRNGDWRDVLANGAGILAGGALAMTSARHWLLRIDQRFSGIAR